MMRQLLTLNLATVFLLLVACGDDTDPNRTAQDVANDTPTDDVADAVSEAFTPLPSAPVEVIRDSFGIPHVYADNRLDLLWAQGYEMARDRIFHLDHMRRFIYGDMAEVYGEGFLEDDRLRRALGFRQIAAQNAQYYEEQIPEVHAELSAFATGVNDYISDMRAGVDGTYRPDEFDRIDPDYWPAPWEPADSIAVAKILVFSQSFQVDLELAFFAGTLLMGADNWSNLHPFTPLFANHALEESPTPDSELSLRFGASKALPVAELSLPLDDRRRVAEAVGALSRAMTRVTGRSEIGILGGSNAWTVGGEHTQSGGAMLCNDTHMDLQVPSVLYPMHLVDRSVDEVGVAGYIAPGGPYILVGNSADLAWGLTNAYADVGDLYQEQLNPEGDAVWFNDAWVPIETRQETIRVRRESGGLDDVDEIEITVRSVPHHGPILNDVLPPEVGETLDQFRLVFSVRWTGFSTETHEFVTLREFFGGSSVQDGIEALSWFDGGAMSWHLADSAGDHAYIPAGPYPERPWNLESIPPYNPLPADGDYEWGGTLPYDSIPRLITPAKGYTVTANASLGDGALDDEPASTSFYLHHFVDLGTRQHRLTELLEALVSRGEIGLEDMRAVQVDTHSVFADVFLPHLTPLEERICAESTPLACDAVRRLAEWDRLQTVDSVEATVFNAFLLQLAYALYRDDADDLVWALVGGELDNTALRALGHWLAGRAPANWLEYVDLPETEAVESPDDLLVIGLERAITELTAFYGSDDLSTWRWDQAHQIEWEHVVWADLNQGPVGNDGGLRTINAADFRLVIDGELATPPYQQNEGSQIRYCVDLGGGTPRISGGLNGGVGGHVGRDFYHDMTEAWLANEHHDYAYERSAVLEGASSTYELRRRTAP